METKKMSAGMFICALAVAMSLAAVGGVAVKENTMAKSLACVILPLAPQIYPPVDNIQRVRIGHDARVCDKVMDRFMMDPTSSCEMIDLEDSLLREITRGYFTGVSFDYDGSMICSIEEKGQSTHRSIDEKGQSAHQWWIFLS